MEANSVTSSDSAPVAAGSDPSIAQLHGRIQEAMSRFHVPGVSVGVLLGGQEHIAGFGVTNVDFPSPVTPGTLFQIGSITKTITATTIMQLVEQGALALETPIRAYLPDLRLADESVAEQVTLRHLLTHTAGWDGDLVLTFNTGRGDDALAQMVARLPELEQRTPLGAVWSYNNAAFMLAGRVIEVVTGKPYEIAVTELTLRPLGLNHAYLFPEDVMLQSFAAGHQVSGERAEVARPWPLFRNANSAGGVTTSVGDLLRYARFVMGDGRTPEGEPFFTPETLQLMQTAQVRVDPTNEVGLSWFLQNIEGVRLVGHDGGTNGQISRFLCAPERGFALVLLTNSSRGGELILETMRWALKQFLGVAEPEPVYQPRAVEQLTEYVGAYVTPMSIVEVSEQDGHLLLAMRDSDRVREFIENPPPPDPPIPVAFYGPDQIVASEGTLKDELKAEFLRDASGKIIWLRVGGRVHSRQV